MQSAGGKTEHEGIRLREVRFKLEGDVRGQHYGKRDSFSHNSPREEPEKLALKARNVLRRNNMGGWTKAAPELYPHQWSWDSAFIAIGLAHLDTRRAARELETLFTHQWKTGKVPHIVFNEEAPPGSYFPGPEHWACAAASPDAPPAPPYTSCLSRFLRAPSYQNVELIDSDIRREEAIKPSETCLKTSTGEEICYTPCNRTEGRLIAGVGGTFIGMISTGLGELNGYFLLQRCRVPSKVAVATSVFVVAATALTASIGHAVRFAQGDHSELGTVLSLLLFTVPGVIAGGQIGSAVARYIPHAQ